LRESGSLCGAADVRDDQLKNRQKLKIKKTTTSSNRWGKYCAALKIFNLNLKSHNQIDNLKFNFLSKNNFHQKFEFSK
jgi:hypothetical protein